MRRRDFYHAFIRRRINPSRPCRASPIADPLSAPAPSMWLSAQSRPSIGNTASTISRSLGDSSCSCLCRVVVTEVSRGSLISKPLEEASIGGERID